MPTANIVFVGDSETDRGTGGPGARVVWQDQAVAAMSWVTANSTYIATAGGADSNFNTGIAPLYDSTKAFNILAIWTGFDDYSGDPTLTAPQIYAHYPSIAAKWKALGTAINTRTIVATTGRWNESSARLLVMDALDVLIRAGASVDYDYFWEISLIPQLNMGTAPLPDTLSLDGTHINTAGGALVASAFEGALNPIFSKNSWFSHG